MSESRMRTRKKTEWNDRCHVTPSKNNSNYHTQYKEFFDKRCGKSQY